MPKTKRYFVARPDLGSLPRLRARRQRAIVRAVRTHPHAQRWPAPRPTAVLAAASPRIRASSPACSSRRTRAASATCTSRRRRRPATRARPFCRCGDGREIVCALVGGALRAVCQLYRQARQQVLLCVGHLRLRRARPAQPPAAAAAFDALPQNTQTTTAHGRRRRRRHRGAHRDVPRRHDQDAHAGAQPPRAAGTAFVFCVCLFDSAPAPARSDSLSTTTHTTTTTTTTTTQH